MTMRKRHLEIGVVIKILTVCLLVVVAVQPTSCSEEKRLKTMDRLRREVDRVNENGGPYIGVVMAYPAEEIVLQSSGLFLPNPLLPWVDLSGRRFNIGSIGGVNVIYVMSGQRRLNAGITVQILLDMFDIRGVVHYGTAGSANNSLSYGDVSVIKQVAFTGSWEWMEFKSEDGELPELKIGNYNLPMEGENLLAKVKFKPEELYSVGQPMREVFWLEPDLKWLNLAAKLQDLELEKCINTTYCLSETPKVVYGLRGSTADMFVNNAAYRKFLFKTFQVSTVDEESAAVLMTAMSTGVPCIVFRGVSDLAGGGGDKLSSMTLSSLAAINALKVTVKFIELIGKHDSSSSYL